MGPVEVFRTGPVVTVYADGLPVQAWAVDEWDELLAAIKADDDCLPEIEVLPTGDVWLGFQYSGRHEILSFTEAEWAEFVTGVRAGEFDIDKLSGPATHGCGAGQAGAPTADGAGQAATGAGGLPAAPAPVAADRPLPDAIAGNRRALSGPDREGIPSAQGSGLRPSPATGAGEVRAASSPPAPVAAEVLGPLPVKPCPMSGASSGHDAGLLTDGESVLPGAAHTHLRGGPNVAAFTLPAGRPSPAPHQVIPPQEAGQPGLDFFGADMVEVDYLAEVITDQGAYLRDADPYALARYILEAGYRRDVVPLKWGSGPLVEHVTEASRSDADSEPGGVPTHVGAATGGWKAGPGLTPVSPGPAEPTGGVS